ncbi:hypothetical protein M2401_001234 [Pseudomonas sp. JUb42]|jgi:hypothetical protein|uniref:hypothetical protein n=1 Tax=Pseudomonas sp. JUb42 TaxID=2940611 RepID=UPI002166EAB0|nr:hypothetical protein [Pseudomonas sp. JUb42]MCS3467513.1 hypothetical protein [Pseudomonas sp. JUb42]
MTYVPVVKLPEIFTRSFLSSNEIEVNMLISQTPAARVTGATVTRMLEQKRAVDQIRDPGSAVARLNMVHKWADIFAATSTPTETDVSNLKPPTFPIEA